MTSSTYGAETLVVSHPNTDFDAFAAMLAAQLLYPGARLCLQGGANRNVREFYNLHAEAIPAVEPNAVDPEAVRRLVLVEVGPERLGPLRQLAQREGMELVSFDHHTGAAAPSGGEHAIVAGEGSLSASMLRLLAQRGIELTPMLATALALGIHEDTGSLTFSSTTSHDVEALAACLRAGANQEMLARYLRGPLSDDQRTLLGALAAARRVERIAGLEVVAAAATAPAYVDDASALTARVGEVADWDALVLCVAMEGKTYVIARSRSEALDVGTALAPLGGGGHAEAASAVVREGDAEAVLARALEALAAVARPLPAAGELMSSPVIALASDTPVAEALLECQRRGHSGLQLCEGDDLVGVAFREDLDRAVRHELGSAPARAVMSAGLTVVGREAPLRELRALIAAGRAHRLVVVAAGPARTVERLPLADALGIVTRTDLLRALHEQEEREAPSPDSAASRALRERLDAVPRLRAILPAVQRVGTAYEGVFLVGGAVRDVLVGEPSLDIDLVIEGDAVAFARDLARELGARSHGHDKFQTAAVKGTAPDGSVLRVDVATARTEFYEAPAALPLVERSTLRQDLARRDFTINAMAASLKAEDLGAVYDFFGGYRDLREGVVRVLHNLSFVEDPTRIFRAVRYEARLGFGMDPHTLSLARGCVEMRLVGDLSSARLRDELLAILAEDRAPEALRRLAELGLDRVLHPAVDLGEETLALIARADALTAGAPWGQEVRRDLVRFACIARGFEPEALYAWLERLKLRRREQEVVAAGATVAPRLAEALSRQPAPAPSELARLLGGQALEALVVALATAPADGPAAATLRSWLDELRLVRLDISGEDLRAAGLPESPALGRALEETLHLKLDGFVSGREDELATARRLAERDLASAPPGTE